MVLHGKPPTAYDLDAVFAELDSKDMDELKSYFIPNISSMDALRGILYKFSQEILAYKERILLHGDPEDLHQFRVNIRKSRAFLKEFSFLFPKEQHIYFSENLKEFATQTNQKRDLDVIEERLETLGKEHDKLQEEIKQKRSHEQQHIREMLQSKAFEDFFHIYQNTLKEDTLLTADNNQDTIENIAKKVIQERHRKIVEKIEALDKAFDDKKLHKIRISLKKFRYLLEEFQHIIGEKKSEKMIKKGKKLQDFLGDYNDAVNQAALIQTYFAFNTNDRTEEKELEHELLDKTSKDKKKLLHKTLKQLQKFKGKPFKL
jgi:CHAD domain-containing protein